VTQQGTSAVRALRVTLLLVVALIAAISLVAMHAVAASASATNISGSIESQPSTIVPTTTHTDTDTDTVAHNSQTPTVDVCACPGGSNSSAGMVVCASLASPASGTVVAQLRAECAPVSPLSPRTEQRALVVAQPTAPSLHVLSISRT